MQLDWDLTNILNSVDDRHTERDEFGKEEARHYLLPLPDEERKPFAPTCRLLSLPMEILVAIIELLVNNGAKSALASWSLASKDCRRLTRSALFSDFTFDCSPQVRAFLENLSSEKESLDILTTSVPSLGSYIRKVTVAARPSFIVDRYPELRQALDRTSADYNEEIQEIVLEEASIDYLYGYRNLMSELISTAMPNLDTLEWRDLTPIDGYVFSNIIKSSVKNLILHKVVVVAPLELSTLTYTETGSWPLRSLSIRPIIPPEQFRDYSSRRDKYDEFDSLLLRLCSSTLESLVWDGESEAINGAPLVGERITFPRLTRLRLMRGDVPMELRKSLLLSAPIRELDLSYSYGGPEHRQVVRKCELSLLETLDCCPWGSYLLHIEDFVRRHRTSLRKVLFRPKGSIELERDVIPMLPQIDNLTSLSLHWPGTNPPCVIEVPETALASIGALLNLTQLRLTGGDLEQGGTSVWRIDHNSLRLHLRPLTQLRKLALCGDSYAAASNRDEIDIRTYYLMQRFILDAEYNYLDRQRPALDRQLRYFDVQRRVEREERKEARRRRREACALVVPGSEYDIQNDSDSESESHENIEHKESLSDHHEQSYSEDFYKNLTHSKLNPVAMLWRNTYLSPKPN